MVRRREAIAAAVTAATALGGCLSRGVGVGVDRPTERRNRLYTCSYDATVAALEDEPTPDTRWHVSTFAGQTRDAMPDRDGNLLIVDDRGLHKYAEERDGLDLHGGICPAAARVEASPSTSITTTTSEAGPRLTSSPA